MKILLYRYDHADGHSKDWGWCADRNPHVGIRLWWGVTGKSLQTRFKATARGNTDRELKADDGSKKANEHEVWRSFIKKESNSLISDYARATARKEWRQLVCRMVYFLFVVMVAVIAADFIDRKTRGYLRRKAPTYAKATQVDYLQSS